MFTAKSKTTLSKTMLSILLSSMTASLLLSVSSISTVSADDEPSDGVVSFGTWTWNPNTRELTYPWTVHSLNDVPFKASFTATFHDSLQFVSSTGDIVCDSDAENCSDVEVPGDATGQFVFIVPEGAGCGPFHGLLTLTGDAVTGNNNATVEPNICSSGPVFEPSKSIESYDSEAQTITYRITMVNTGDPSSNQAYIRDYGYGVQTFISSSGPLTCSESAGEVICSTFTIGSMQSFVQYLTFSMSAVPCGTMMQNQMEAVDPYYDRTGGGTVNAPKPGCVPSSSSSSSSTSSSSSSSSSCGSNQNTDEYCPTPNIEVEKSISSFDEDSQTITYSVVVSNTGDAPATDVKLEDYKFSPQDFISSSGSLNCEQDPAARAVIVCDPFTLGIDESIVQYFTFDMSDVGCDENVFNNIKAYYNANQSNDTDGVEESKPGCEPSSSSSSSSSSCGNNELLDAICEADISISKYIASFSETDQTVTYGILITNNGNEDVTDATVEDYNFEPQDFIGDSGPLDCYLYQGESEEDNIDCDEFTIPAEDSVTQYFTFDVSDVSCDSEDQLENHVVVRYNDGGARTVASVYAAKPWCNQSSSSSSSSEQPFTPQPSTDTRAGGHRGHRTNEAYGVADWLASFGPLGALADLPSGAFGGSNNTPLSPAELDYICAVQRSGFTSLHAFVPFYATYIAQHLNRDPSFIEDQLNNPTLCDSVNSALLPASAQKIASIVQPLRTDTNGFLISSNQFWNLCFREAILGARDFEMNPDTDKHGIKRPCSYYKLTLDSRSVKFPETWRFITDAGKEILVGFNRATKEYLLPEGYVIDMFNHVAMK